MYTIILCILQIVEHLFQVDKMSEAGFDTYQSELALVIYKNKKDKVWSLLRLGYKCLWFSLFCFMVFNTTFNNISIILWQSILLME